MTDALLHSIGTTVHLSLDCTREGQTIYFYISRSERNTLYLEITLSKVLKIPDRMEGVSALALNAFQVRMRGYQTGYKIKK